MQSSQGMQSSSRSLVIRNISWLWTPEGSTALHGAAMRQIRKVQNACVVIEAGKILWVGEASQLEAAACEKNAPLSFIAQRAAVLPSFDAKGRACVPGFVDSHTHFIFSGWRENEFFWRMSGIPYMEIHARGGGIQATVDATRALRSRAYCTRRSRLDTMLSLGITT